MIPFLWHSRKGKTEELKGFPSGSDGRVSVSNAGDPDSIPGLGRSPGEGNGSPLQYSCRENPMDRGAWWATVHGVAESLTRLSNFTFTFKELKWASQVALVVKNLPSNAGDIKDSGLSPESGRSLEEGMATHRSILAWRIPWTEEPGGLQSIGSHKVGNDWSDLVHTRGYLRMGVGVGFKKAQGNLEE